MRAIRRSIVRHLGPLFVCFAVALAMLMPHAGWRLHDSTAQDLSVHVSAIIEARRALEEGQFPIRVAPTHDGGTGGPSLGGVRVPLFQFYGNFPYTLGGAVYAICGLDPYTAWRIVHLLSLTFGGFYLYRSARAITRRPRESLIAAVIFMTAPYMWADLHARFAFPEFVSFNFLPVVFFYSTRALVSPRLGYVFAAAIAWSLLALSHNVTFLYASALLVFYFLSFAQFRMKSVRRLSRVGIAYVLGIFLTAWYLAPQYYTVPLLNIRIASGDARPVGADVLTPLSVLLWPVLRTPEGSGTERLGLQIGWPTLVAVMLGIMGLAVRRRRAFRAVTTRLIMFFTIACVMTWSAFNFWKFLPSAFAYVQSSYRLLTFVDLFGSLLVACAFARLLRRPMTTWLAFPALLLIALPSISYIPQHERLGAHAIDDLIAKPLSSAIKDYHLAPAAAMASSLTHPEVNWALSIHGVLPRDGQINGNRTAMIRAPRQGGVLKMTGTIPNQYHQAARLVITLDHKALRPLDLPEGAFAFAVPYAGPLSNDVVEIAFSAEWITGPPGPAEVIVATLQFPEPIPPDVREYVGPQDAFRGARQARLSSYAVASGRPALVVLPILYYPRLLRVRENGQEIPYANVGRLLAVETPSGPQNIEVTFAGIGWANVVSVVAWIGCIAALVLVGLRRRRRVTQKLKFHLPIFNTVTAILLFAMLGGMPLYRLIDRNLYTPLDCTVSASRPSSDGLGPGNAFDADETTAWAVPGGGEPVTLTVIPKTAKEFGRITLVSRRSGLWESWHRVKVRLYLRGDLVYEKPYEFPDADAVQTHQISFHPKLANRIELEFSDPVTVTRDGKTHVDPNACSPGYAEIRIE